MAGNTGLNVVMDGLVFYYDGAGFGSSPVGELFTGTIYSAKVYNIVLTANESLQNYYAIRNRFNI